MQDLDFSQQTLNRAGGISPSLSQFAPESASKPVRSSNRNLFTPLLIVILLSFSLGVAAGVFIGKAKQIESSIISQPDELRPEYAASQTPQSQEKHSEERRSTESTSFTNIAGTDGKGARFLIKVGVYSSTKAQELTAYLNRLSAFQGKKAYKCKDISRNSALDQLAFRIGVPKIPSQENVFLGCFVHKDRAANFLGGVLNTNIPQMQGAKLYEIED